MIMQRREVRVKGGHNLNGTVVDDSVTRVYPKDYNFLMTRQKY